MQELVSKYEFVEPNVKIELEGELGLNLYEIAKSLQTRYAEVKEKLERMSIAGRITIVAYTVIVVNKGFHKHEEKVPILPVSEAKFFVAKYDNEIGDAYTRFLIKCEETLLKKMREELSKPKAPHYISLAIPRVKGDSQALAHKRNMTAFFSAFERIKGRKPSHDDIKIYVSGLNKKIYGTHEKQMRDENTLLGQMIIIRSLDLITEKLPKSTNIGNVVEDSIKEIKSVFIQFEPQILLAHSNNLSTLQISA